MIIKTDKKDFEILKQKFKDIVIKYPLINAVLSNIQEGYVYSNKRNDFIIVITKYGFSLFYSLIESDLFLKEVFSFLIKNKEIPNYIHFYAPSKLFEEYTSKNWSQYKIRDRIQFRYNLEKFLIQNKELPNLYSIAEIQNIDFEKLAIFNLNLDSRYWNSKEIFLEKSIGVCVLNEENNPIAICYSACIVDQIAEMDTLILPEYRGKKLMKLVTEYFFEITKKNNIIPHWDTFIFNEPSYKTGKYFNPYYTNEYRFLSIFLE